MTQQQGALYLRVRPQAFDEVLGNEAAIASLTAQLQKPDDKRSRVYFFTGPSGCGKNTLTYIFAKMLSDDIQEVDAADKRTIADAREITSSFPYLPATGDCRVLILNEVGRLTPEAQEVFLDPLENCPKHLYVLLLSSNPSKIKKDIFNRCQEITVQALSTSDAKRLIKQTTKSEGIELPKEAVTPIIEASEGSSRQILQNVEKVAGALESGAALHEALKLLSGPQEDDPGVKELYKALCAGDRSLRDTLKTLKTMDPETLRRGVLGYASAIYLNTGDGVPLRIMQAMSSGNTFDCGFPGLVALCSLVAEG